MRQFYFLIISAFLLSGSVCNAFGQVADSTDVFDRMTDIEKQIRVRSAADEASPAVTVSRDTVIRLYPSARSLSTEKKNPLDSLYRRKPNGTLELPAPSYRIPMNLSFRDTMFINPLYLPLVFNGKMLPEKLSFYPPAEDYRYKGTLIAPQNTFAPMLEDMRFANDVRRQYYLRYPERVKMSAFNFGDMPAVDTEKDVVESFNPFKKLIEVEKTAPLDAPSVETVEIERKYWIRSGEHSLQFSQNYFSKNWYKGGTSNLNINNYHVFRVNYQKKKVKFDNTFEWRLSLFNAPEDTLREYRISDDLIRYYGSLGVDAFLKKWSYSTNLEVKSQLFNNYAVNSSSLLSAFLSPLYVNAGIGMRYQLDKKSEKVRHRRVRWTLDLAPISVNYKSITNKEVDVTRYGIPEGKWSKVELGSTVTSILKYDVTRYVTLDSRFKYFTSYKNILAEFENTLNMSLSNYFSTRIYLHMRFDDGVPKDPSFQYLQINEVLSFGLNYKW